ncbi:winged helix-turn-helix domain-containing protein [Streptomyces sp. DSM 3412]|uniref:Winged helix-turn-helix domain-containing protein n=1 Tax=Streptomyces gottesmaniae TaxID=3075518 RepID=A0ABU2YPR9_9ACTN|nr:winged helix-turn-helix domain-containing protein [Streptomyces sp. DSM 3412]MDT0566321.1 winged helix-turn-helix domain-containing protein [Streptomyces sp. DSM 3412]
MQFARLERDLERGLLAHGWADQRWTPARVKTLIGRLFHVSSTVEGTCAVEGIRRLLRRHGCPGSHPARRAIERDDAAVELRKQGVWPLVLALCAWIVRQDEAGQSMAPPPTRTW